ncbi:MAG: DUF2505 family protein [Acidimicrobiales bacterium]|jgi:hypothetical protein
MKFSVGQNVAVAPDDAAAAYGNPAFYEGRARREDISIVEVVGHDERGSHMHIDVRYRFTGNLSSAVRAVVDPTKLTWVTRTDIDRQRRGATFTVLPDHYPDRLSCAGTFGFAAATAGPTAGPTATVITIEGDLKVRAFLVGRTAEQVIVSGLRSYLEAEASTLPDFIAAG